MTWHRSPSHLHLLTFIPQEGWTALMKVAGSGSANNANPEQDRMRTRGHAKVLRMLLSHPNVNVNVQDKVQFERAKRLDLDGIIMLLIAF